VPQIESYERPYVVVYGEDGGEQQVITGPEGHYFPIYKARRMVVALLTSEIEKESTTDEERKALQSIRLVFNEAETGALVFGKIQKWLNRHGKRRFIGMVEKDQDYRKAGLKPAERDPNYQPPRVRDFPVSTFDRTARPSGGVTGDERKIVSPKPKSDAERIAEKMAKSAREAVDGDGGES
jgi:hypothetical protein